MSDFFSVSGVARACKNVFRRHGVEKRDEKIDWRIQAYFLEQMKNCLAREEKLFFPEIDWVQTSANKVVYTDYDKKPFVATPETAAVLGQAVIDMLFCDGLVTVFYPESLDMTPDGRIVIKADPFMTRLTPKEKQMAVAAITAWRLSGYHDTITTVESEPKMCLIEACLAGIEVMGGKAVWQQVETNIDRYIQAVPQMSQEQGVDNTVREMRRTFLQMPEMAEGLQQHTKRKKASFVENPKLIAAFLRKKAP